MSDLNACLEALSEVVQLDFACLPCLPGCPFGDSNLLSVFSHEADNGQSRVEYYIILDEELPNVAVLPIRMEYDIDTPVDRVFDPLPGRRVGGDDSAGLVRLFGHSLNFLDRIVPVRRLIFF